MRLLVVSRSPPEPSFSWPVATWRRMKAQPPGPGLPLQAPSVNRCTWRSCAGPSCVMAILSGDIGRSGRGDFGGVRAFAARAGRLATPPALELIRARRRQIVQLHIHAALARRAVRRDPGQHDRELAAAPQFAFES